VAYSGENNILVLSEEKISSEEFEKQRLKTCAWSYMPRARENVTQFRSNL